MRLGKMFVDAGMINAVDEAFVVENGGTPAKGVMESKRIKVAPGKYEVTVRVRGCWLGAVERTATIEVKGNAILVGDICYTDWTDWDWDAFLKTTDYCKDMKGRGLTVSTGGDGEFSVEAIVKKVLVLERGTDSGKGR